MYFFKEERKESYDCRVDYSPCWARTPRPGTDMAHAPSPLQRSSARGVDFGMLADLERVLLVTKSGGDESRSPNGEASVPGTVASRQGSSSCPLPVQSTRILSDSAGRSIDEFHFMSATYLIRMPTTYYFLRLILSSNMMLDVLKYWTCRLYPVHRDRLTRFPYLKRHPFERSPIATYCG